MGGQTCKCDRFCGREESAPIELRTVPHSCHDQYGHEDVDAAIFAGGFPDWLEELPPDLTTPRAAQTSVGTRVGRGDAVLVGSTGYGAGAPLIAGDPCKEQVGLEGLVSALACSAELCAGAEAPLCEGVASPATPRHGWQDPTGVSPTAQAVAEVLALDALTGLTGKASVEDTSPAPSQDTSPAGPGACGLSPANDEPAVAQDTSPGAAELQEGYDPAELNVATLLAGGDGCQPVSTDAEPRGVGLAEPVVCRTMDLPTDAEVPGGAGVHVPEGCAEELAACGRGSAATVGPALVPSQGPGPAAAAGTTAASSATPAEVGLHAKAVAGTPAAGEPGVAAPGLGAPSMWTPPLTDRPYPSAEPQGGACTLRHISLWYDRSSPSAEPIGRPRPGPRARDARRTPSRPSASRAWDGGTPRSRAEEVLLW